MRHAMFLFQKKKRKGVRRGGNRVEGGDANTTRDVSMEATKEENKDKTPLFLLFLASWDKLRWLGREEATKS